MMGSHIPPKSNPRMQCAVAAIHSSAVRLQLCLFFISVLLLRTAANARAMATPSSVPIITLPTGKASGASSHITINARRHSVSTMEVAMVISNVPSTNLAPFCQSRSASPLAPRRLVASPTLQLVIPSTDEAEAQQASSSNNESPVTPVSLASPVTRVVDLTRSVRTISSSPVAHGGLSDIYKGEWDRSASEGNDPEIKSENETVLVAIKLLRVIATKDLDFGKARKRLNREVYVWHRLEHPNIVKLFGTSYHMEERPAMIMRWYDNGSAADYLATKNPNANRIKLVLDVAKGLAYLHTHDPPIVHGDLKGNNVLITDEGRAVLCDFGLSRVIETLGAPKGNTLSHPDVGPLRWQAPEFLDDEDTPEVFSSDVWSFGCTAYELLTSNLPYSYRSRDGQIIKDIQRRIKPRGQTLGGLEIFDHKICDLLDRCWSFSPDERPLIGDIEAALQDYCNYQIAV